MNSPRTASMLTTVTSVSSQVDLNIFIREVTAVFADAKFELRGWEFSDKPVSENLKPTPVLGML